MAFQFMILTVSALLGTMSALNCPDDMYDSLTYCCKLCPPGTFLKHPCNESKGSSICHSCPGETYMDKKNNNTDCHPCRKCAGPSQVELVPCKKNQNRECGCEPGKYHNPDFLFCMDCLQCAVGEGAVSPCKTSSNTICQPCKEGTFSDKVSYEEPCLPCATCEPGGIVVEECNSSRDTICKRSNITHTPLTSKTDPTVSQTATVPTNARSLLEPVKTDESNNLIYIIGISAVVLVALAMIVVAIYCCLWRRREDGNNEATNDSELEEKQYNFVPPTSSETPAQARSSHGLRGRRTNNARQSGHQRDSDSQGSNGSLQGVSIGNGKNKTLIRDLPGHVYGELGVLLNPKSSKNWVTLAGHLDFTSNEVRNLELVPEEATQRLLGEWGQQDGSTVDVLIAILKKMKRDDCVLVLKQWDS